MLTKAEINLVRSLDDRSGRHAAGLFVAEGLKMVSELPGSGLMIREVYCLPEIAESLPFRGNVREVSPKEMSRISRLKTPSGVVALVEMPRWEYSLDGLRDKLSLALDGVQDPGNMGTIIRIADWFGIEDMFCSPASADCFGPKAVQASMGAIARVRVHYLDLGEFLCGAASGIDVYGTFLDGENIYGAPLGSSGVILMGSEGSGISPSLEGCVGSRLLIPPFAKAGGNPESLNVAAATAVVCSEFRRRYP